MVDVSNWEGRFGAEAVGSEKSERLACLPPGFRFDVAALDGPMVPRDNRNRFDCNRLAERSLSRGMFQRRCKPGFSHFGFGRQFRTATATAADEIAAVGMIWSAMVEPFPNAYLGVLLEDSIYSRLPVLRRGQKFDWLHERAIENDAFERVM
jgi:hypothetical protein